VSSCGATRTCGSACARAARAEVCDYVLAGEADLAIATEAIAEQDELVMLPCYQWNRCVIARPATPSSRRSR
jgi:DNA-binding transcriptional LysR family regulator